METGTTTVKNLHAGGRMRGRAEDNGRRREKEQKARLCLAMVLFKFSISVEHFQVLVRNIVMIGYLVYYSVG